MSKSKLFLVTAILLGWTPTLSLWLNPPPLIGDEAYYARVPVEMRERKDWIVPYFNGEPRYKKPPLMYWFVALSQSVFGENEFASRLPSLIAVVLTGLFLAWFGLKVGATETGLWAAAAFLLNPMTVILGNWGAPEATLCLFVTTSALSGLLWLYKDLSLRWILLSGISAGAGVLTKGAPGLILPAVVLFPVAIWKGLGEWKTNGNRTEMVKTVGQIVLWLTICFAIAAPWFIVVWLREGEKFWQVFLLREHIQRVAEPMEGHRGPIWFYLLIVWLLFLPWSICLPYAFANVLKNFRQSTKVNLHSPDFLMAWWALSVVVLFSLIATKLPHYIFPAFPALAWLVASQVQRSLSKGEFTVGLLLALLPVPLLFYGTFVGTETYAKFVGEMGFKPSAELDAMRLAAYTLLSGVTSVPLIWGLAAVIFGSANRKFAMDKSLLVGAVVLSIVVLVAASILMKASSGRNAVEAWTKLQKIATFGSDTEWAVFYAKRPVPMLGRSEKQLKEFLTKFQDAAILARVDFAPILRRNGLTLRRFGIWCVATQTKQKR